MKRKYLVMVLILSFVMGVTANVAAAPADMTSLTNQGTEDFVERLYLNVLGRSSDRDGMDYWSVLLKTGEKSGAEVVRYFFESEELYLQSVDDNAYVDLLYAAIMGRSADLSGKSYWLSILDLGMSKTYLLSQFIESEEFSLLCQSYGIDKGSISISEARDINIQVTQFVARFYQLCLDRKGDSEGLNYWTELLLSGQIDGAGIADSFLTSREFLNKQLNDSEYIAQLYRLLMGREADQEGHDYWLGILASGLSQRYALKSFIESTEFTMICNSYGINNGTIEIYEARDERYEVTRFVFNCYLTILKRAAGEDDLNYLAFQINSGIFNAKDLMNHFFLSTEYSMKNTTNETFISDLYESMLGREISEDELNSCLAMLNQGSSREDVMHQFRQLDEFKTVCRQLGISNSMIDPTKPMVALTYDDGPSPAATERILNCLERYDARATFFVVGANAAAYPHILKRQLDLGCEIGNHTYSHPNLAQLSAGNVSSQINTTNSIVAAATGTYPTVFRPPYGSYNQTVCQTVGLPVILWSVDTLDWKTRNASSTISSVLNNVRDGDIILMHDLYAATAEASETIIPALLERGYQLVTVSELAEYRGGLNPGSVYTRIR